MDNLKEKQYIEEIVKQISNRFSLTKFESEFLLELNLELKKPIPSIQAGVQSRVLVLDNFRLTLLNFIYSVNEKYAEIEYEYKEAYDPAFVKLTRAGRPNQQSVDSEININPAMSNLRKLLKEYEAFRSLLFGYLKTLDHCKESCLKKWSIS